MKEQEIKKWASLLKGAREQADTVPAGWRTAKEISVEMSLSVAHVHRMLSAATENGTLMARKFRIQTRRGPIAVWHFKDDPNDPKKKTT